jgi:hypothetical protein
MPPMIYQWRSGTRLSIDAQRAGETIELLRTKVNGHLTPAHIVDAARSKRSILHTAFEWDDAIAAEAHREDQARYLIGALVVTVRPKGTEREVRAFVSVSKNDQQGYTALHTALSDADLRKQVVAKAWAELHAWKERHESYFELAEVFAAIEANDPSRP